MIGLVLVIERYAGDCSEVVAVVQSGAERFYDRLLVSHDILDANDDLTPAARDRTIDAALRRGDVRLDRFDWCVVLMPADQFTFSMDHRHTPTPMLVVGASRHVHSGTVANRFRSFREDLRPRGRVNLVDALSSRLIEDLSGFLSIDDLGERLAVALGDLGLALVSIETLEKLKEAATSNERLPHKATRRATAAALAAAVAAILNPVGAYYSSIHAQEATVIAAAVTSAPPSESMDRYLTTLNAALKSAQQLRDCEVSFP